MEVDLSRYGCRATIGTKGTIAVPGEVDVKRVHAELRAAGQREDSSVNLRAVEGEVWVIRARSRILLLPGDHLQLTDGDYFEVGRNTFVYHNLNDGMDDELGLRRALAWLE